MARIAAFVVGTAVLGSTAVAASPPTIRIATAVCATRSFTVAFDPSRQVVVTDGRRVLASASFTTAKISSTRCRRVAEPKGLVTTGLGPQVRERVGFRCATTQPIRVHVNPIRNADPGAVTGSALVVGIRDGSRLRVIVSAQLKNKGDANASWLRRAAVYCKPGA